MSTHVASNNVNKTNGLLRANEHLDRIVLYITFDVLWMDSTQCVYNYLSRILSYFNCFQPSSLYDIPNYLDIVTFAAMWVQGSNFLLTNIAINEAVEEAKLFHLNELQGKEAEINQAKRELTKAVVALRQTERLVKLLWLKSLIWIFTDIVWQIIDVNYFR